MTRSAVLVAFAALFACNAQSGDPKTASESVSPSPNSQAPDSQAVDAQAPSASSPGPTSPDPQIPAPAQPGPTGPGPQDAPEVPALPTSGAQGPNLPDVEPPDASLPEQSPSDAGSGPTSCDPRKLLCRRAAPVCPEGQVPRVSGTCYGACVAIDECACAGPEACPQPEQFTCNNSRQRCTYYLR